MRWRAFALLIWLALTVVCVAYIDRPVMQWLYDHHFHDELRGIKHSYLTHVMQALGYYPTVLVLVILLVLFVRFPWRKAAVTLICSATSVIADVLKWVAGRSRPILKDGTLGSVWDFVPLGTPANGGSFPSGHTVLAFATATCLAQYYPRWAWLWYLLASIVAASRVLEVAHHVSDVVAAAGIGVAISTTLAPWLEKRLASPPEPQATAAATADTGAECNE